VVLLVLFHLDSSSYVSHYLPVTYYPRPFPSVDLRPIPPRPHLTHRHTRKPLTPLVDRARARVVPRLRCEIRHGAEVGVTT